MSRRATKRNKRFDVFEFTDEDERVERESAKIMSKFKNSKKCLHMPSPVNKYKFLQCFSRPNERRNTSIRPENTLIDLDIEDGSRTKKNEIRNGPIQLDAEVKKHRSLQSRKTRAKKNVNGPIEVDAEVLKSCKTQEKKVTDGPIDVDARVLQNRKIWEKRISHGPIDIDAQEIQANRTDRVSRKYKLGDIDAGVTGQRCTLPAFCPVNIRQEEIFNLDASVQSFPSNFENERVRMISDDDGKIETSPSVISSSYVACTDSPREQLSAHSSYGHQSFAVCDPCWSERQGAIKSSRYKDRWKTLSNFDEHFKEVIYPKGDPDAVSISKRDFELLKPERFINDTIIDFYMKYLKNKIRPEEQHRFHFFNSFFFHKLSDQDKVLSGPFQARAAFQRVHKWTRKVDIFEKDYILIPVNYSFHWSLIVLCHPGEVANLKDDGTEKIVKVPCILHMDSIRGSHRGLKKIFQGYLSEEWKDRHREAADDVPSKFVNVQFVQLELPQQENSFDCGLFLLHYVELFLLQAPTNFNPLKIMRSSSNFLSRKWFPPAEASLKRSRIQKLIYEILEEQSHSSTSTDSLDVYPSSLSPNRIEQETGVKIIEQISNLGETSQGHSSNCNVEQGSNNFSPTAASPPTVLQSHKDSGLEIRECHKGGICGGLLLGQRNAMSPIEEIEEIDGKTMADLSEDEDRLSRRYLSEDFGVLRTQDVAFDKPGDSLDSSEIRLDEDQYLHESGVPSHGGKTDKSESSSTSNEVYSGFIVEDSEESSGIRDDIASTCSSSPYLLRDIYRFRINLEDLTTKADLKRKIRRDMSDEVDVSEEE